MYRRRASGSASPVILHVVNLAGEPRIDDLPFFVGEHGQRDGAAFTLHEPARGSLARRMTSRDCREAALDNEEIWHTAHAIVQEGPDCWSYRKLAALATQDPFGGHPSFWDDA